MEGWELYSAARSKLKRGIRDAKAAYRKRIESHFEDSNPRRAWQGIRQITNYKYSTNRNTSSSAPLADQLNHFFSRFEVLPLQSPAQPSADAERRAMVLNSDALHFPD
ncbi:hypothetical protein AAFF_G00074740 [Aldrovandia affinis]|uniref:Uncharacterized protein n=1 Tax=Aldrovandia affinis TaxID=143900 RepID=A0AAD7RY87_9TELE|nr:hypothetical protein AAFF_G00074740 [Aldrovandia affinis]